MPNEQARPPLPPFTRESAIEKVRLAEDAWNTREPKKKSRSPTRWTPNGVTAPSLHQSRRSRGFPNSQVEEGAGLPSDQRALGVH